MRRVRQRPRHTGPAGRRLRPLARWPRRGRLGGGPGAPGPSPACAGRCCCVGRAGRRRGPRARGTRVVRRARSRTARPWAPDGPRRPARAPPDGLGRGADVAALTPAGRGFGRAWTRLWARERRWPRPRRRLPRRAAQEGLRRARRTPAGPGAGWRGGPPRSDARRRGDLRASRLGARGPDTVRRARRGVPPRCGARRQGDLRGSRPGAGAPGAGRARRARSEARVPPRSAARRGGGAADRRSRGLRRWRTGARGPVTGQRARRGDPAELRRAAAGRLSRFAARRGRPGAGRARPERRTPRGGCRRGAVWAGGCAALSACGPARGAWPA